MLYHKEADVLYLANRGVGSASTRAALEGIDFDYRHPHHGTMRQALLKWPEISQHTVVLATVRKHGDWWRSHMAKLQQPLTVAAMEKALEHPDIFSVPWRLYHRCVPYAKLLRFHFLEKDLNARLQFSGLPHVMLPKLNVIPAHQKQHHTWETFNWVDKQFREEIFELNFILGY